ncbi:iron chelate uptake ABC transporter family permease subunit [Clostridium sp. E02]|uniref:FecCD family ABC transporter permease n=1 Tax=Clostridium sp. E02 TaxID=2487134 RepID=UPI000F53F41C|nr:iron chelate uptake ABC transporter family permease subunit [Clostridium sp. E02]
MIPMEHTAARIGYKKRRSRSRRITLILTVLVSLLAVIMLVYGNTIYPLETVLKVLAGEEIKGATFAIKTIRLPRMLVGLLVGLGFGMAGYTFQTLLRNDLASPDMIGVTSGSSVAAVFCILVLKMSGSMVSFFALLSGLLTSGIIYLLSMGKGNSKGRFILMGIGLQAMLQAVISYLLLKSNRNDVGTAFRWLSGSLNGVQMEQVKGLILVVILVGTVLVILNRQLQVLQLGDASATILGVNVRWTYGALILASVFLIAFSSSVSGPVASVSFLSGPIASQLTGKGKVNPVAAGLVGAILIMAADLVGQYAFKTRYPVGVITGILGAPYLLFLLVQMNKKGESVS